MHELRLHKHLKTKEVEMLVSATINIISVDEKVGNFCLFEILGKRRRRVLVAFPVQSGCGELGVYDVCKKSDYNSDSFKTHGCTRGGRCTGLDG